MAISHLLHVLYKVRFFLVHLPQSFSPSLRNLNETSLEVMNGILIFLRFVLSSPICLFPSVFLSIHSI